jgi:hypothetical protein
MKSKAARYLALMTMIAVLTLFNSVPTRAHDGAKDEDRLENSGVVARELMNIPDDIPQKLLNKADCVIVIPSVLKAAFIVGAGYGRGAMTCRSGENFRGPWRRQLWTPDWWSGDRLHSPGHESSWCECHTQQQSEARCRRNGGSWPVRT